MKALVRNGVVIDIEKRDIDVYKYYHKDVAQNFIDCPDDITIGDSYIDGEFVKSQVMEVDEK